MRVGNILGIAFVIALPIIGGINNATSTQTQPSAKTASKCQLAGRSPMNMTATELAAMECTDKEVCDAFPGFCRIMDKLQKASPMKVRWFTDCIDHAIRAATPNNPTPAECHKFLD